MEGRGREWGQARQERLGAGGAEAGGGGRG